jgi:hypothetical protein
MYRIRLAQVAVVLGTALFGLGVLAGSAAADQSSPHPQEAAVTFLEGVLTTLAANDYALAWQTLHPLHQAAASEEEYVACERLSPIPGTLDSLVPVRVRHKPVTVAGLPRRVRGVAVTFRLRFADKALNASAGVILTAAAVRVDRHWAWMLPPHRYKLYADDACSL